MRNITKIIFLILIILINACSKKYKIENIELKTIKNQVFSNALEYIKSTDTQIVKNGIYILSCTGKDNIDIIFSLTNLSSNIIYSSLSFINEKSIEKSLDEFISNQESSLRIIYLTQRFLTTKKNKYFRLIVNDYVKLTDFEEKKRIIYYMTELNKINIQKFFRKEMRYFGNIVYKELKDINEYIRTFDYLTQERIDFFDTAFQYFGTLDNYKKLFPFFYFFILSTKNYYYPEKTYNVCERINDWTYGNNRILFSDFLIKNKIWERLENISNRFQIKSLISFLTTNVEYKNSFFEELKNSALDNETKETFLLMSGNEELIIKNLYSNKWKEILESIIHYRMLNFLDEVEKFIINEEYKKFVTKNKLKEAEEYVYFNILSHLYPLIIEKNEPLSKHIHFFDSLRKKNFFSEKVNHYKSQFDVRIIKLIWLVENGYFEY